MYTINIQQLQRDQIQLLTTNRWHALSPRRTCFRLASPLMVMMKITSKETTQT